MPVWLLVVLLVVAALFLGAGFLWNIVEIAIPIAIIIGVGAIVWYLVKKSRGRV